MAMRSIAMITSVLAIAAAAGAARAQQAGGGTERPTSSDAPAAAAAEGAAGGQGSPGFEGNPDASVTTQSEEVTVEEYQRLLELPPAVAPYEEGGAGGGPEADASPGGGGLASPFDVILPDERQQVTDTTAYPARAVVLITTNTGRCSGFLYGRDVVATAGHCVHSGGVNGQWKTNVRVFPGRNGGSAPFGSCGSRRLHSVDGWTKNADKNYDYGVIKLDCNVGDRVGWFGYYWTAGSLNGTSSTVQGYPGDKPLTQWLSRDQVRVTHDLKVFYFNDTAPGTSGGVVYHQHPQFGTAAFAIHTNGRHNGPPWSTHNAGTRITQARFNNMEAWRNAP
jgi:glutamyl endopeptidase